MFEFLRGSREEKKLTESAVAVMEAPKVVVPVARQTKPKMTMDELAEYRQIAAAIGMESNGALTSERLERFLLENNIHTYNSRDVVAYLDKELGADWVWAGLRKADVESYIGWTTHMGDRDIKFGTRVYRGAVPLPVLLTIQKIQQEFPEAYFHVSESARVNGDPFLRVGTHDSGGFIVERWDEPSFRERTAK